MTITISGRGLFSAYYYLFRGPYRAKTYRKLQDLIGPVAAVQLDSSIALALTRTRAISAASISKETPRGIASSLWNPFRRDP